MQINLKTRMANQTIKFLPQIYARTGGIVYLIIIVVGIFGEMVVRGGMVVPGNAAATANNISTTPLLWRLGISGDIIMHICDAILMLVFYVLLRPVHKNLALLAVLFNLIQTGVLVANKMNLLLPLFFLGGDDYLKAFDQHQLDALSYISIKAHDYGFGIGLIFFGFVCLIDGYLIFRSGFLPRILGRLMQLAGLCYLINSFALIIAPKFGVKLFPAILLPSFVGELSLCLWLLFKGVNVAKWREKAAASGFL
jgi:hypothetical protein